MRRRRLRYRAWHRGTREMDLILGPFADAHVERMDDAGTRPARDAYGRGRHRPPQVGAGPGAAARRHRHANSSTASSPTDRTATDHMTDTHAPDRTIANVPDGMQPLVLARLVEERLKADARRAGRRGLRRARRPAAAAHGGDPRADAAGPSDPDAAGLGLPALRPRLAQRRHHRGPHERRCRRSPARATRGAIVLTAVNALIQKLPPRDLVAGMSFAGRGGAGGRQRQADRLGGATTATCACRRSARPASMRCAAGWSTSSRPAWRRRCGSTSSAASSSPSAPSIPTPSGPPARSSASRSRR